MEHELQARAWRLVCLQGWSHSDAAAELGVIAPKVRLLVWRESARRRRGPHLRRQIVADLRELGWSALEIAAATERPITQREVERIDRDQTAKAKEKTW